MRSEREENSLEGRDNKAKIPARQERKRSVKIIADEFKRRYQIYKSEDGQIEVSLYVGDFQITESGMQLVLPTKIFSPVDYSSVLVNFLKVFDNDRSSQEPDYGRYKGFTQDNSHNLRNFKSIHPDSKLDIEYMAFGLLSPKDEERMIIRERYFDPVTKDPLTESWKAIKYKINS